MAGTQIPDVIPGETSEVCKGAGEKPLPVSSEEGGHETPVEELRDQRYCMHFLYRGGCKYEADRGEGKCSKLHEIPQKWKCDNCGAVGKHRLKDCGLGYCKFFRSGKCESWARTGKPCPLPHTFQERERHVEGMAGSPSNRARRLDLKPLAPHLAPKQSSHKASESKEEKLCGNCQGEHPTSVCERPCIFFLSGECKNKECKLKHSLEGDTISPEMYPKDEVPSETPGEIPKAGYGERKVRRTVCRFYPQGKCKNGDDCPFIHPEKHTFQYTERPVCVLCSRSFTGLKQLEDHKAGKSHRLKIKAKETYDARSQFPYTGKNCHNCGSNEHQMKHCPVGFCIHFVLEGLEIEPTALPSRGCRFGSSCSLQHIQ